MRRFEAVAQQGAALMHSKKKNSHLRETLERQRTTSYDLQNILYSTDIATLLLDTELNIRFFTPAAKALFSVISSDVGRPLANLSSLATDSDLLADARAVLQTLSPVEREIEAQSGAWYIRRILPYRTQDNGVEGVVITFADITEFRHTAVALENAKREAQLAALSLMRGALDRRIREGKKEEAHCNVGSNAVRSVSYAHHIIPQQRFLIFGFRQKSL